MATYSVHFCMCQTSECIKTLWLLGQMDPHFSHAPGPVQQGGIGCVRAGGNVDHLVSQYSYFSHFAYVQQADF